MAEHVNKQLERRRQRRKYSIDSKDDRYRLIESHLTWADVCSMVIPSSVEEGQSFTQSPPYLTLF